ncbi:MAG: hypothetical protein KGQ40_09570 [Rhodospirillales bacterium]|nr:hypothetical protein [Rhodospirillales bacterium]
MDVVELQPGVRPTEGELRHLAGGVRQHPVEPGVAIDLQQSGKPFQVRRRMRALAIFAVEIRHRRMPRPGPRAVIRRVAPQPPGLGLALTGIEHRQRRVVGEHPWRGQHRAQHRRVQRFQPPAGPSHPVAECGTIELHTVPGEHLRLAIQRQVIAVFADQHVRDQRLGGHAAIQGTLRGGRLHHRALAAPAAIFGPADYPDPERGRRVVQHLGTVFADDVAGAAAVRAGLGIDIDHHLDPRQMCGQRAAIAPGWIGRW